MASSASTQPSTQPSALVLPEDLHPDTLPISQYRREKIHVFWEQDHYGLWTSPTCKSLALPIHFPIPKPRPNPWSLNEPTEKNYINKANFVQWYNGYKPHLAFWPLRPEYSGPFACLGVIKSKDRSVKGQGGWFLFDTSVAENWLILETKLISLLRCLLRRNQSDQFDVSYASPSDSGYKRLHRTNKDALRAVLLSHNDFLSVTAALSFAIAVDMGRYPPDSEGSALPTWIQYAVGDGVDPIFVDQIYQSFVCDFSAGSRPGVYMSLKYQQMPHSYTLQAFVTANVPLYVCWDYYPRRLPQPEDPIWRFYPTHQEARNAIERYIIRMGSRLRVDVREQVAGWWNMPCSKVYTGPPLENPDPDDRRLDVLEFRLQEMAPRTIYLPPKAIPSVNTPIMNDNHPRQETYSSRAPDW